MNELRPEVQAPQALIRARSKRQAMDWSLVLASQEIPTTISWSDLEGWTLVVEPTDHARAMEAIRLFRLENRGWGWQQHLAWPDVHFHLGSLFWCLGIWAAYVLSGAGDFIPRAVMSSAAVTHGEWWRLFTAMLLHADHSHFVANAVIGFILLGLAMAQYGPGPALCLAWLAGAFGNLCGYLLYPTPYQGVGASGMVMGALGLLAATSLSYWRHNQMPGSYALRAAIAGGMLFMLLGLDPSSDVVAHLGGFLGGMLFGALLHLVIPSAFRKRNVMWLVLLLLLLSLTTALAFTSRLAGAL
ncbi:MAG: rhomboid family intramembrane serine protease [Verrucomicrobiota bacterium]